MVLERIPQELTVCKMHTASDLDLSMPFYFIGKTEEEISLVCPTASVPRKTVAREDGWKAFRIQGTLDFSLVGILAGIASILAEGQIGIFAVSTYNTDYILVKHDSFDKAADLLVENGYTVL